MHRTPLPKIPIFFIILSVLLASMTFSQAKPSGEVDISKCWAYPLSDAAGEVLSSDGSRAFLGLHGAKVDALSIEGKKLWSSEFGGEINSNILALDSGLLLVTSSVSSDPGKPGASVLRSLSKETGITNWTLKMPDAEKHFLNGFNGWVVVVSKSGVIQSIDAQSGAVKWKREIAESFAAEPTLNRDKLVVATTTKQIFGVSLMSGEIHSMRKASHGITALGELSTGEIMVGDERGNISSLVNGTEKPYWKFKSGGEISAVFVIAEHLIVASHDNFIYFLAAGNGGLIWKKRLTGRVSQIATYTDRFALITSFEEHSVVLADLANGKVAGQIPIGEEENLVYPPIVSAGLIFILTNKAAYAFGLNGCSLNKNGGLGR